MAPNVGSLAESDASGLLAELLDNDALWSAPNAEPVGRTELATTAARVYDATFPTLSARVAASRTNFDRTITLVRDIADRCAVLSQDWTRKEMRRWWSNLVTRARVEEEIRLSGLDESAARQGVQFNLASGRREEVRILRRLWRARASKAEIADDFFLLEREYAGVEELRAIDPSRLNARPRMAHGAAGLIGKSRNNLLVAMGMHDAGAEAVAEATLTLAQSLFAIAQLGDPQQRQHPERSGPTPSYLRHFLQLRTGDSWLRAHAKNLPAWLS